MSYCNNCGQSLLSNQLYCQSCGTKVFASPDKGCRKEYAQKMYKNAVQSLEKEGKSFIEKQVKQQIEKTISKPKIITESPQQLQEVASPPNPPSPSIPPNPPKPPNPSTQTNTKPIESQGGINIWTWIYLAVNLLLMFVGYRSDAVIGVMLFTIVILLFVFLRRNKPKPYNWVVKIILILQAVVLLVFAVEGIEYFNIIILLMVVLFLVNLRLLFKGNK